MLIRTHYAITLFFILLLFGAVDSKLVFVVVALIATLLPDVDSRFSTIGRRKIARILQFFTKHRGITHSFTFLVFVSLFFVMFFPIVALGFFVGYSSHLLADSFTVDGVQPFWPSKKKSAGSVRTGGKSEVSVLVFFIILDLLLFFRVIYS